MEASEVERQQYATILRQTASALNTAVSACEKAGLRVEIDLIQAQSVDGPHAAPFVQVRALKPVNSEEAA